VLFIRRHGDRPFTSLSRRSRLTEAGCGLSSGVIAGPAVAGRAAWRLTVRTLLEREGLVVAVVALWAFLLAVWLPALVVPDTWLALVDGRLIALSGLPHVDTVGAWTFGRPWTDQQWGAHLLLYELGRYLGVAAVVTFGAVATVVALALTGILARRLGGSQRSVALVLLFPVLAAPWMAQARTQSFAVLLFPLVYGLVALDSKRPSRQVFWVVPLLVAWANLHGSVALAAAIVVVHGLTLARQRAARVRGLVLAAAAAVSVFASPYAFELPAYYRLMLINPPFAAAVNEWGPASFSKLSAVFFLTVLAAVGLGFRGRSSLVPFERWALPLLLLAALAAMRNAIWFEFAAAMALPRLLDLAWPSAIGLTSTTRRINRIASLAAITLATLAGLAACAALPARLAQNFPPTAAAAVAQAAGSNGIVYADDEHSDWLAWKQPSLVGRIAYDVRFELFNAQEMSQVLALRDNLRSPWLDCGRSASVVTFASVAAAKRALAERVIADERTVTAQGQFVALRQKANSRSCNLSGFRRPPAGTHDSSAQSQLTPP
jgi:hypothetical protein